MSTNSFIQVPPDGVGKRIHTRQHTIDAVPQQVHTYHLADPSNPDQLQFVDNRGQSYVRFAEGSPSLDSFGNLRVGQAQVLGAYEYTNDSYSDLFQDLVSGAGNVDWVQSASKTVLSVDSTSGSSVSRTTNRWHYYQPGVGNMCIFTLHLGDSGKAGNVRRWGYFCARDGLYWELDGTELNVVLRSRTSGPIEEIRLPRSQWNGDKLDGTGLSGMTIDLTKANYFWLDFAWLGVGIARFGILAPDGSRWVCHTFENPNNRIGAYMGSGSLPVRFENFNTTATAGTSEMHLICSAVYASARTDYTFWRYADAETTVPKTITVDTPVVSLRPKLLSSPGYPNRIGLYPDLLNVFVTGGSAKITIYNGATLTGANWVSGQSTAEYDVSATDLFGGEKFLSFYVGPGATTIELCKYFETNDEGYHVLPDATASQEMVVAATKLDGTTVTMSATIQYRELA